MVDQNVRIARAAYGLVHSSNRSAQQIAEWLGRSVNSLYKEVDPNAGHAKFGLADAVEATKFTQNHVVLNAFAAECGCMVLPMPDVSVCGPDAARLLASMAKEFADLATHFSGSVADDDVTLTELSRIEKEAGEVMAAVQAIVAHALALYERNAGTSRPGA